MGFSHFLLVAILTISWRPSAAAECDLFMYGRLCSTVHPSDTIWTIPDLENEIKCQDECVETTGCSNFMFTEFTSGNTECFLLRSCDANSTYSCSSEPDCLMAISGPATPSLVESCCEGFEDVSCEAKYEVGHEFDVFGEQACQQMCRDNIDCAYWTLYGGVCFFYSDCGTPEACTSCTSGAAFPDMSTCTSHQVDYTLLLGGDTPSDSYSATLEMLTPNLACTPDMPMLPVRREGASAALFGSTIFYCGGFLSGFDPDYHGTCHSYLLGKESQRWEEQESMNYARRYFGLTVIGDRMYASGGQNELEYEYSVESFSPGTGWTIEEQMRMPQYRWQHCSVALGTKLVIIGGGASSTSTASTSVVAFDTSLAELNTTASWVSLHSLGYKRWQHACGVGQFEGLEGIFVAGGADYPTTAEFYTPSIDMWRTIDTLSTGRNWHSLTIINGQMVVAGGDNEITSVETLNGTEWVQTNNLKVGRDHHAALSIPAGLISCQM